MKEVKRFMQKLNIDFVKVLGYLGAGLSVAATVVSGIAQKKSMNETIAKEVAEAMKNHQ
jgi:F0F1-type ATP synthase membrane subunit c/vacuolar-type H+-ATPase subunit K